MLSIALSIILLMILSSELYMGIVVIGFGGEFVERSKSPDPYWLFMALHCVCSIGFPVLAWFAEI